MVRCPNASKPSSRTGNEFFQYRAYEQGEDLKVVDWKVYAKRSELVAKTYQEDTNFSVFIVIDSSASMGYTGENTPYSKLRYASMLGACLAYLAYRQGDKIGFFGYGEETQQWIRPASGSGHLQRVLAAISSLKAKGTSQHEKAWDQLANVLPARTMVVFLSDFLESEDTLSDRLRFPHLHIMNPCVCRYSTLRNWICLKRKLFFSLKWKETVKSPLLQMQSAKDTKKR